MTNEKLNNQEVTAGFESLFEESSNENVFNGANQLNKTAQLTSIATNIAQQIFAAASANPEEYQAKFLASQKSHDAMDDLIGELYNLGEANLQFLAGEDDDTLEKMIRSQQSKRSRSKSKVMTKENYMTMLVGAVAENLLRLAAGKPKSSGGGAVMGDIGFTEEDLQHLAEFPEELKKAIRNVQSKKSIMKSKADFDPTSARWSQLLRAEQQLKEVRDVQSAVVNQEAQKALEKQKEVEQLLENADEMSPDEAAELLNKVKEMLASK